MAEKPTVSSAQRPRTTRSSSAGASTSVERVREGPSGPSGAETRSGRTVNLPFVTATFRALDVRMPQRSDLDAAVRRAGSLRPSGKAALYYGGLAATVVAGVIEWPVAAAIGVGTALASRG